MNSYIKLTWVEFKLFLREPMGVFFTLAFPLLMLFLFGAINGNEPTPFFGGLGSVDNSMPGYIGIIIGTLGLIGLPVALANYRQNGILRRFRATPLQPSAVLWSQVAVNVALTLVGTTLLFVCGRLFFNLVIPSAPPAALLAIILGGFSFIALGFVLAGVMPTARTAQAVGMALFFPMLFLSGAAVPRQILPDSINQIANFLPLAHVVRLIEGVWHEGTWNMTSLAVVVGTLLVSLLVSARTFRWE